MELTEEEKKIIYGDKTPEKTPVYSENKHKIDDMKTDLELQRLEFEKKKLEMDMAKLNKPDTSVDYYSKMLEMQQAFNNQLLAQQKNNFDIQLQLAKLELGQESEWEKWLGILEPYLPTLIGKFAGGRETASAQQPIYVHNERGELVPNPNIYKKIDAPDLNTQGGGGVPLSGANVPVNSAPPPQLPQISEEEEYQMNIKQYQQDVRDGKISLEQAWADFQREKQNFPKFVQNMSKEEFTEAYNKIRGK